MYYLCVTFCYMIFLNFSSFFASFNLASSTLASSNPKCVYTFIVTAISECPIRYCSVLGLIPSLAILLQKVCLHTCGVIGGSWSACSRLYFSLACCIYFSQ